MLGANITDECYHLLLGLGEDDWYSKDGDSYVTFVGGGTMIAILLSGYIPPANDNYFVLDELVLKLEKYDEIDYKYQNDEEGPNADQKITGEFLHILYKLAIKRGRGVDIHLVPGFENVLCATNELSYCCGEITEAVLRNINSLPTLKAGRTHKKGGPLDRLMKLFPKDTIENHWNMLEIERDLY